MGGSVPAARMDAALKRSRSEEPAEPLPPARDLDGEEEEEEEERMEQGLEEEEEVDPRIQVGRAGGVQVPAPRGLPRSSDLRVTGLRSVRGLRVGATSVLEREEGVCTPHSTPRPTGRLRCPRGHGVTGPRGSPADPRDWGSLLHAQRLELACNKEKRGRGPGSVGVSRGRWASSCPAARAGSRAGGSSAHLAEVSARAALLLRLIVSTRRASLSPWASGSARPEMV